MKSSPPKRTILYQVKLNYHHPLDPNFEFDPQQKLFSPLKVDARNPNSGQTQPEPKKKVVVRRLPYQLPQDIFENTIQKWSHDITWLNYIKGKPAKTQAKDNIFSRAYLGFSNADTLFDFCKSFDGHTFIDSKGIQFKAVVEFAPFQRIPDSQKKRKTDARLNTINEDPMYISFLEELKSETKKEPEKLDKTDIEYLLSNPKEQPKTTPLLEALRSQKSSATKKKSKAKAKKSQVTLLSRPETSNNNESSSTKEPSQVDISQDNRNRDPENRNGNKNADTSRNGLDVSKSGVADPNMQESSKQGHQYDRSRDSKRDPNRSQDPKDNQYSRDSKREYSKDSKKNRYRNRSPSQTSSDPKSKSKFILVKKDGSVSSITEQP